MYQRVNNAEEQWLPQVEEKKKQEILGSPTCSLGKRSPELVLKTPAQGKACMQSPISQSWVNREGPSSEGLDTAFASSSQSKTQKTKDWVRQEVEIKNSERPGGVTYNLTIWNVEAGISGIQGIPGFRASSRTSWNTQDCLKESKQERKKDGLMEERKGGKERRGREGGEEGGKEEGRLRC